MNSMRPPTRTYKDAINALNSLQSNFSSIEATKKLGPNVNKNQLSLNEVYEYTRRLGYRPADFNRLNLIHVTGTKGKGSTCAFTELILRQYQSPRGPLTKIGLFTSPHLKTVRERLRINGRPIDELKFAKYFFEVWDTLSATELSAADFPTLQPLDTVKPMYFKYLTILSFHVFMSEGVDTAIYEVGVGGTYDSTNIIDRPTVVGILSLGIDHTFMLGPTIELITENKTGIFKRGVPAIVSDQPQYPQTIAHIEGRARQLGAASLEVVPPLAIPADARLGLAGDFQRQNAALAVLLAREHLRALGVLPRPLGTAWELPQEFRRGLEETRWEGRCQVIKESPRLTWFVDGAHTAELVTVALEWFRQQAAAAAAPRVLFFNQQNRDNAAELVAQLFRTVGLPFDHVVFTTNVTWALGAYDADLVLLNTSKEQVDTMAVQKELAAAWGRLELESGHAGAQKHVFADIETAVSFVRGLDAAQVFVCGSLHLVGGLLVVMDGREPRG